MFRPVAPLRCFVVGRPSRPSAKLQGFFASAGLPPSFPPSIFSCHVFGLVFSSPGGYIFIFILRALIFLFVFHFLDCCSTYRVNSVTCPFLFSWRVLRPLRRPGRMSRRSSPCPFGVTASLERRNRDLALAIRVDGSLLPGVPPWRRVSSAREALIREAFEGPDYMPAPGECRSAEQWVAVWARLRAEFRERSSRGSAFNSSRLLVAARQCGARRFGTRSDGGGGREDEMKAHGCFVVPLFEPDGSFANRLEGWCLRQFELYAPALALGCCDPRRASLCLDFGGGSAIDLCGVGLELRVELLDLLESQLGLSPSLVTQYRLLFGEKGAHVGDAHGDHSGGPSLAAIVVVGAGGAVSTAVVQVGHMFRSSGTSSEVLPSLGRVSYEHVKRLRWEEVRTAGLRGDRPRCGVWGPSGMQPLVVLGDAGASKNVSSLRWGEPDPTRRKGGRPLLPQGSAFCFDASSPHLFPGVCPSGEPPRLVLYVGYGGPRAPAVQEAIGWRCSAVGELSGRVLSAFDGQGAYLLQSSASLSRTTLYREGGGAATASALPGSPS